MHLLINKKLILPISVIATVTIALIVFAIYYTHNKKIADPDESIITTEKIVVDNRYTFHLSHAQEPEKGLVIYISDSSAPTVAANYAKKFAELSYYVASIDSQTLFASIKHTDNHCVHLAEILKTIGQQLQETYHIDTDELPILVGNDEGAALVYTALMQSDKHYFHAGVSINFTPHINTNIPLCSLNNTDKNMNVPVNNMTPAPHLSTNWYVFQGVANTKNSANNDFIAQIGNAKLTTTQDANADPVAEAIQILQWLDPRLDDQITSDNNDSNLPIIEVPAESNSQNILAVLVTGDGGWAEIDKNVAKFLSEKGIPTIALDSLSYFWRERTQEETAQDIDDVINQYREKWQKDKIILIGYSFGADVLPFIANKLSADTKEDVKLVALLAMGKTAAFEFRLSSWMNADTNAKRMPTIPELKNMAWANTICIYGVDDEETACKETAGSGVKLISMSGDHHFDEKYDELVQHIIENIK